MAVKPLLVESVEVEALKEAVKEKLEQEQAAMVTRDEKEGFWWWGLEFGGIRGNLEVGKEREVSETKKEAWRPSNEAVISYCGSLVGTVAANDRTTSNQLSNDQVFIRDFVPSSIAFFLKGESEIVRNFLLHTFQLQVKIVSFSILRLSRFFLALAM